MEKAKTLRLVILWGKKKQKHRKIGALNWIASKAETEKYGLKYEYLLFIIGEYIDIYYLYDCLLVFC